jgi:hypothetical protein
VLLQTMHDIIGNSVAFFFRQPLTKTPHKFARALQRKRYGKTQHVPARAHFVREQTGNRRVKRLSLPCRRMARNH